MRRIRVHKRIPLLLSVAHPIETAFGAANRMTFKTTARLAFVLVLSATVISACGRKGDLEVPGAASSKPAEKGKKQQVEDRPFLLDPLL
jgi:predicted small lipoprotein YifL